MSDRPPLHPDTLAIHGRSDDEGRPRDIAPALYPATTWRFESSAELERHLRGEEVRLEYARYGSPTVREAELRLAALEGAEDAILLGSGMAALSTALLSLLGQGRHVVFTDDGYRPSRVLVEKVLSRFGVTWDVLPVDAPHRLMEVARPGETRVVFTEFPTNPHLRLPDLGAWREAMRPLKGARLLVDSTLATPWNARPLERGAHLVMHSVTKYLAGHNDLTAGVLAGASPLVEAIREVRGLIGATADPHAAWLLLRGLKTFPTRMARHNASARWIAERLLAHRTVERVHCPGLPGQPLPEGMSGVGGLVSFVVRGGRLAASRVIDECRLIQHAASLGGPETLIQQPAVFSWSDLDDEALRARGLEPGLLRLSVGLEHPEDLWADLDRALNASAG